MDDSNNDSEHMESAFNKAIRGLILSYGNFDFFDSALENPNGAKLIIQVAEFKLIPKFIFFNLLGIGFILFGLNVNDLLFRAVILLVGLAVLAYTFYTSRKYQRAINALSAVARDYGKIP